MTRNEVLEMMRHLEQFAKQERLNNYRDGINFSIGVIASIYCNGDYEKTQKILDELNGGKTK